MATSTVTFTSGGVSFELTLTFADAATSGTVTGISGTVNGVAVTGLVNYNSTTQIFNSSAPFDPSNDVSFRAGGVSYNFYTAGGDWLLTSNDGMFSNSQTENEIVTLGGNTDPVVNINIGLTVAEDAAGTIGSARLDYNDAQQADSAIIFTITSSATNGTLLRNGLALGLGGTFSQADINANLISFDHDGSETTSASFGFSVSDGQGGALSAQTFSITVTAVNDAPQLQNAPPAVVTVTEDVQTDIELGAFSFTDADSGGGNVSLTIQASAGTLFAGSGGGVTVANSGTGTLTLTGTIASLNAFVGAGLTDVSYQTAANANGANVATLTYSLTDNGNSGAGGGGAVALGSSQVNATAVNDAPTVATNTGVQVVQGEAVVIDASRLAFTDLEQGAALTYTVSAVTNGVLARDGNALGAGSTFTQTDLGNGLIEYAHDDSAPSPSGFTFSVSDDVGGITAGQSFAVTVTSVEGNASPNTLRGTAGSDTYNGRGGADRLFASTGNDTYNGGIGSDTVDFSGFGTGVTIDLNIVGPQAVASGKSDSFDSIERLTGSDQDDRLAGNAAVNVLEGGSGDDRLNGYEGGDTLRGGAGNDTYVRDDAGDVIEDTSGYDTVATLIGYTIGTGIERVVVRTNSGVTIIGNGEANRVDGDVGNDTISGLGAADTLVGGGGLDTLDGGDAADVLLGGADADTLTGGSGADRLDGGVGADTLRGGLGDDDYYVDDAGDVTDETGGNGYDIVRTTVDYTVASGIERAILGGATGRTLTGNGEGNRLDGGGGGDTLSGLEGGDTLAGGDGGDVLEGGGGNDVLDGGAGADRFIFSRATGTDGVRDFGAGDELAFRAASFGLTAGDPVALQFGAAATGAGATFLYNAANRTLYWDSDGAGGAAAERLAVFSTAVTLTADDFFLIS